MRRYDHARVLMYSHDTFGLGHLRRCREIAHALVERFKRLHVLIISGSSIAGAFDFRARVDFIKMDIEGAEVAALHGGRATIAKYRPRMALSVYHQAEHPVEVPKAVRAAWEGYRTECGTCLESGWNVRPEVLFFH